MLNINENWQYVCLYKNIRVFKSKTKHYIFIIYLFTHSFHKLKVSDHEKIIDITAINRRFYNDRFQSVV